MTPSHCTLLLASTLHFPLTLFTTLFSKVVYIFISGEKLDQLDFGAYLKC